MPTSNDTVPLALPAPNYAADIEWFFAYGWGPAQTPEFRTVHSGFETMADRYPNLIAVEHGKSSISYDDLNDGANRLAAALHQLGVNPGDNVGVFIRRSIPMVAAILATLKAGAAYVPQDARIVPTPQLTHVATTIDPKVILTVSDLRHKMPELDGVEIIEVDRFLADLASPPRPSDDNHPNPVPNFRPERPVYPSDRCFILFTSGTTGMPNGVQVNHRGVCNTILTSPADLGLGPGRRISQLLNISFDMASWEILSALTHGATLVIRTSSDFTETARQVDTIIATPTILSTIDPDQCPSVNVVAVGGEPCPQSLADTWSKTADFYNCCGPTETSILNTMKLYDPNDGNLTIGTPTPNNTVYILDEDLNPLPIGEVGEMWAGGEGISDGYLNNPDLTDERYRPDPFLGGGRRMFRTRDLGRWTPSGELEHLGRTDDQVKVRGFRVELDSVSSVLEQITTCRRAAALKLDSHHLAAVVSPETVDEQEAKEAVAANLPYYCVPKHVIAVPEIPMTDRGKIDKRQLLRLAQQRDAEASEVNEDTIFLDDANTKTGSLPIGAQQ